MVLQFADTVLKIKSWNLFTLFKKVDCTTTCDVLFVQLTLPDFVSFLELICLHDLETFTVPLYRMLYGEGLYSQVTLQQWESDHILAQGEVAFENTRKNKD